jgi:hypothetical protein
MTPPSSFGASITHRACVSAALRPIGMLQTTYAAPATRATVTSRLSDSLPGRCAARRGASYAARSAANARTIAGPTAIQSRMRTHMFPSATL